LFAFAKKALASKTQNLKHLTKAGNRNCDYRPDKIANCGIQNSEWVHPLLNYTPDNLKSFLQNGKSVYKCLQGKTLPGQYSRDHSQGKVQNIEILPLRTNREGTFHLGR
jgi:hypothetical protein